MAHRGWLTINRLRQNSIMAEESVVISRAIEGDMEAFGHLYKIYEPRVRKWFVGVKRLGEAAAEDLAQTVFEKALGSIRKYKIEGPPIQSWLFGIAAHVYADYFRDGHAAETRLPDNLFHISRNDEHAPIDISELFRHNENLFSPRQKETVLLLLEGLAAEDIAGILGVGKKTVHEYVGRSRRKIEPIFVKEGYDAVTNIVRHGSPEYHRIITLLEHDPSMGFRFGRQWYMRRPNANSPLNSQSSAKEVIYISGLPPDDYDILAADYRHYGRYGVAKRNGRLVISQRDLDAFHSLARRKPRYNPPTPEHRPLYELADTRQEYSRLSRAARKGELSVLRDGKQAYSTTAEVERWRNSQNNL